VLLLAAAGVLGQDKPDFSGVWIVEGSPGPEDPHTLIVTQPLMRTTLQGKPRPPTYFQLIVEKRFATSSRRETYDIGTIGGVVGGLVPGNNRPQFQSRNSVAWDGDKLRISSSSYEGPIAEKTLLLERSEVWSFDDQGKLRLDITERTSDSQPVTRTVTYHRP
jgi:hypothetical protein